MHSLSRASPNYRDPAAGFHTVERAANGRFLHLQACTNLPGTGFSLDKEADQHVRLIDRDAVGLQRPVV